jgi:hypothetical protein
MMALGIALYSLRKRAKFMAPLGNLGYWLDFHIFLCTLGPFVVVLHTTFKFGGIVSISFWSMVLVVASGVLGRYLYGFIPKAVNGQFLTLRATEERKGQLIGDLHTTAGLPVAEIEQMLHVDRGRRSPGLLGSVATALRFDLTRRSRARKIRRWLEHRRVPPSARKQTLQLFQEQMRLQQQLVLLKPFQRLFGYWHVFHLPLAIVMFVIMAIHIAIALLFGYTWVS